MKSEKKWKSPKFQGAEDKEFWGPEVLWDTQQACWTQTGLGKQQLRSEELKMPSLPQLSH